MIYGMIFGISIIIAALTRELFPFYFILLGGIACMVIVAIVNMQSAKRAKTPPALPPPPPGSPAPPTPPAPAPAPAASVRSYGWVWWIIIIIAIVFVGRWIWYETGVKSTYSPPQATAPGKTVRQKFNLNVNLPDTFNEEKSRGSVIKVIDGTPFLFIKKNGKAVLEIAHSIPKEDFLVHYAYALAKQSAYISFKINGVEIPFIFTPAPEGQAAVGIDKEMVKENNSLTISSDQAIRISGFRFEEK